MKWQMLIVVIILLSSCTLYQSLDLSVQPTMTVYVKGAVMNPQEVELPSFSTIHDLLELIELQKEADLSALNGYTILKHMDIIDIPFLKKTPCISINFADAETLETLNGIGPAMAARIIDYRESQGLFQQVQHLQRVKGIGVKLLSKLLDRICL